MATATSGSVSQRHTSTLNLILVPALVTLGVTVLRLVGELQDWSPVLSNRSAGGGGAIIGIVWLAPIFGIYFALKLAGAGEGPRGAGRAIGFAVLGLVIMVAGGFVAFGGHFRFPGEMLVGYLIMAAAALIQLPPWPALGKALLAYGYAARIPVAIVMFFAMRGNWGTHYDALPPEYGGPMSFWPKYAELALLPQLILWVVFTVISGALFGTIATAIARRKPAPQAAA